MLTTSKAKEGTSIAFGDLQFTMRSAMWVGAEALPQFA
jgi:hypothetical protein